MPTEPAQARGTRASRHLLVASTLALLVTLLPASARADVDLSNAWLFLFGLPAEL